MAIESRADAGSRPVHDGPRSAVRGARIPGRTVLLVASFGALLAFLDATIVNIAFPSMREDFPDESIGTISWVLNAYNIVFASFMIVFGRLSDVMGRGSSTCWVSSCSRWHRWRAQRHRRWRCWWLRGGAAGAGCGDAGAGDPAGGDRRGPLVGRRARAVGLWAAAAAVAAGLGPPIGGLLVEVGGWRWAFWINLPLGLLAWWLGRRLLVNSRAPGRSAHPGPAGRCAARRSVGPGRPSRSSRALSGGASSITLWLVVGGALVMFAAFVASSIKHPAPVPWICGCSAQPAVPRRQHRDARRPASASSPTCSPMCCGCSTSGSTWLSRWWSALVPGALVAAITAGVLGTRRDALRIPVDHRRGVHRVGAGIRLVSHRGRCHAGLLAGVAARSGAQRNRRGCHAAAAGCTTLATQPDGRYATASAVISSARQIGGTIGVALLVVILGMPTPLTVVEDLREGWMLCIASFVAGAVITLFLGRLRLLAEDLAVESMDLSKLQAPALDPNAPLRRTVAPVEESLFARLPSEVRKHIELTAPQRTVLAGEWMLQQGAPASSMFVRPLLAVQRSSSAAAVVREPGLGAGAIGELALLTGGVRSASIRARRDCRVLEVPRSALDEAIGQDPGGTFRPGDGAGASARRREPAHDASCGPSEPGGGRRRGCARTGRGGDGAAASRHSVNLRV